MNTGKKFLKLSRAETIIITNHAKERIENECKACPSHEELMELFLEAKQLKHTEVLNLGYRPKYGNRKRRNQDSWYFQLQVEGEEFIAVVTERNEEYFWVTTYSPNEQTLIFRERGR